MNRRQLISTIGGAALAGSVAAAAAWGQGAPETTRALLMRAFLEDAVKTQIDILPMTGAEVEAFIARLSASSPAVIERAKQAYRND